MNVYYRFQCGNLGIYEAVERDCPRSDSKRSVKPDGSWLPRVGKDYPGHISYWTEHGLEKYISSGLQDWHRAVVNEPPAVFTARLTDAPVYQDEFQVIAPEQAFTVMEKHSINDFFSQRSNGNSVKKVAMFVTRKGRDGRELLVFRHADYPELGIQVPAGTIDPGESPEEAAVRELREESGLELTPVQKIGEYVFFKNYCREYQHRHVFQFHCEGKTPDIWTQTVFSTGSDKDLVFQFAWQPVHAVDPAILKLEGIGDALFKLVANIR